jgi:uncharacterized protein (DUF1800 family)
MTMTTPIEAIVFSRMAFGASKDDLAAFNALPGTTSREKFRAYVEQQLYPENIDDGACEARLKVFDVNTLDKSQEDLWRDHNVVGMMMSKEKGVDEYIWKYKPTTDAKTDAMIRAVYSKRQLLEVLVDFWHNHFNVYPDDNEAIYTTFANYRGGVIRKNALGNFRVMLEEVAASTAMLAYLDNAVSQDGGPNENFARELLELHTLGSENYLGIRDAASVPKNANGVAVGYVDNDVYEVARCFTGWTFDANADWLGMSNTGAFLYKKEWHDRFNKIVLGKMIRADQDDLKDGRDVLDLLASHPGTARHIARKLCRRLISDTPSARVIEETAQVFLDKQNEPDQLRHVIRAILLTSDFQTTFGEKIKRPFEAAIGMMRAVNADILNTQHLEWWFNQIGQPIFGRRPPDGYPDKRASWSNTVSFVFRWRFAIGLSEGWIGDKDETKTRVNLLNETPEDKRMPEAAVDYWSQRILQRPLPKRHRDELARYMLLGNDDENYSQRLTRMVQLILMSPEFQLR